MAVFIQNTLLIQDCPLDFRQTDVDPTSAGIWNGWPGVRISGSIFVLEAFLKSGFWPKIKAAVRFRPEEYTRYFEDLNLAPNAEIGPKGAF